MISITNVPENDGQFNFRLEFGLDFAKRKVTISTNVWEPIGKKDKKPSKIKLYSADEIKQYAQEQEKKHQHINTVKERLNVASE